MSNFKLFRGYLDEPGRMTDNNSNQNGVFIPAFEPMRQNRFLIIFPEIFNISPYLVRMASRPTATFNDGLVRWDDMQFTLHDPISPSMSQTIYELIGTEILYSPMVIKLQMLGPVGDIISDWSIWGAINSADFGDLDYSSDELADVTLNMSVSNVILNY
jgi:hypothetical protein